MKRLGLALFIMASFVAGIACSGFARAETLELGIPLPLTGTQAKFGEMERRAYEIAAEEINAKGGIKGKTVVLHFEDSLGKPETSRAIAEKLIDAKQPILVGDYSSACSKAIAAVANERKVPYLVVTGADDSITQQGYDYVFRLNPTNAYYPTGMMSFLNQVVKPKSIVILHESSDFGTSGANEMEKTAEKNGIKVLLKEKYEKGAVDFKPILTKVKALKPRGLMAKPKLLMLDEPSLGLAPILVREIFNVINRIRKEGVTVLIVEQNVKQTLAAADRAYVLENGRVTLEGSGADLANDPHVQAAYLGV